METIVVLCTNSLISFVISLQIPVVNLQIVSFAELLVHFTNVVHGQTEFPKNCCLWLAHLQKLNK